MTNYERVEQAIIYLAENFKDQPSLDVIANHVGVSPFHFQRIFQEWAGVSPKKFLQYISIEQAKEQLSQNRSLLETSLAVGLSGTSRLHDLFITIEGMTPGGFKGGADNLNINYSFAETRFGKVIIASTEIGICYLAFCNDNQAGLNNLQLLFPNATKTHFTDSQHRHVLAFFRNKKDLSATKLHLKGTPFQLKVWAALLQVPTGYVSTYRDIAQQLNLPKSSRAVGNAVGSNPVAYIIPCHRVIRSTGIIGGYRWGSARKQAILGWEAVHNRSHKTNMNRGYC